MGITMKDRWNKILPVGGPGEAVTPLQQSQILFNLFGLEPKYIKVPIAVFDAIIGTIEFFSKFFPSLVDTAEFAKIGRYYATEDMVGPSYGTTTLKDFFEDVAEMPAGAGARRPGRLQYQGRVRSSVDCQA